MNKYRNSLILSLRWLFGLAGFCRWQLFRGRPLRLVSLLREQFLALPRASRFWCAAKMSRNSSEDSISIDEGFLMQQERVGGPPANLPRWRLLQQVVIISWSFLLKLAAPFRYKNPLFDPTIDWVPEPWFKRYNPFHRLFYANVYGWGVAAKLHFFSKLCLIVLAHVIVTTAIAWVVSLLIALVFHLVALQKSVIIITFKLASTVALLVSVKLFSLVGLIRSYQARLGTALSERNPRRIRVLLDAVMNSLSRSKMMGSLVVESHRSRNESGGQDHERSMNAEGSPNPAELSYLYMLSCKLVTEFYTLENAPSTHIARLSFHEQLHQFRTQLKPMATQYIKHWVWREGKYLWLWNASPFLAANGAGDPHYTTSKKIATQLFVTAAAFEWVHFAVRTVLR